MLTRSPRARLAAVTALAAATAALLAAPADADTPSKYVALGDSFVSGPLIPNPAGTPLGCLRSDRNYPHLLAEDLGVDEFTDVSCGGATTADMFEPQTTVLGVNPAQLDALTPDTTLVTLGIGGNDIGFIDILVTCVTLGAFDPHGAPCEEKYTATGTDELRDEIDATAADVTAVLDAIGERAPNAEIAVVGYLPLLPETTGCWPKITIAKGDVPYLDGVEAYLNDMLAGAAAGAGASFVDVYERGHDICQGHTDRWVEGIFPSQPAAPAHPNAKGMRAVAGFVLGALS